MFESVWNMIEIKLFLWMLHFIAPEKRQQSSGTTTFLGGIEMEHWPEIGYRFLNAA